MKTNNKIKLLYFGLIILALGLVAFTPAVWPIQTPDGDQFVLGDNYLLEEDETLNGSLIVLGGNAQLEEGSTVERDVVVMGGNLHAAGLIEGDVNIVGGQVTLDDTAVVEGDVNALAGNLVRADGAQVEGDVNTNMRFPFFFRAPATIPIPEIGDLPTAPFAPVPSALNMGINIIGKVLWWIGRSFIWALLALVTMLFLSRSTERVAYGLSAAPVQSGLMGLLSVLFAPIVLTLLVITICGIPFALIGALALIIAWAFGIVAIGLETGQRLSRMIQQDWAPTVNAAVGTFVLTLLINGISALVPCVGWLVPFTVGLIGLGAVVLTRFGGQVFPPPASTAYPPSSSSSTGSITPTGNTDYPGAVIIDEPPTEDLPPTL